MGEQRSSPAHATTPERHHEVTAHATQPRPYTAQQLDRCAICPRPAADAELCDRCRAAFGPFLPTASRTAATPKEPPS
ncbi:hypothetical protein [Nocardia terpenica]|uniref:hypothetical protein n=1 Tax=Nocardia terpenica TaxID=455432 RepID=UPI0012FD8100|nr:hypothetical protein [Nocardia terpenica]